MTTGTLILNIVMIAVATALVAIPAVFIPNMLDRDLRTQTTKPVARPARRTATERRWAPDGYRSDAAA